MKVKRFNNLWTMGLIIFGALLVGFYVLKIACPQFIVGVAEIPSIVKFGTFVDSHKIIFYFYHFAVSFFSLYFYCCACCRTKTLCKKQTLTLALFLILGILIQEFLIELYTPYNYMFIVFMPFLMCVISNRLCKETFISTSICFSVDIISQALSSFIRNIVVLSTWVNSSTITILVIDVIIWRVIFYFYFNNKIGGK